MTKQARIVTITACVAVALTAAAAHGQIINGGFSDGLDGWEWWSLGNGEVYVEDDQAVLAEHWAPLTTLRQDFILPSGAETLRFDLDLDPGFDDGHTGFLDQFGIKLWDPWRGTSAVPTAGKCDYFLLLNESGFVYEGDWTTWDGTTAYLDVSALTAGMDLRLSFVFLGGDWDHDGEIGVDNVLLTGLVPLPSGAGLGLAGLTAGGFFATARRRPRAAM